MCEEAIPNVLSSAVAKALAFSPNLTKGSITAATGKNSWVVRLLKNVWTATNTLVTKQDFLFINWSSFCVVICFPVMSCLTSCIFCQWYSTFESLQSCRKAARDSRPSSATKYKGRGRTARTLNQMHRSGLYPQTPLRSERKTMKRTRRYVKNKAIPNQMEDVFQDKLEYLYKQVDSTFWIWLTVTVSQHGQIMVCD